MFLKPLEKRPLTGKNLLMREGQREPCSTINLGIGLDAPGSRRPLNLECVAAHSCDIEIAFHGESINAFSASLTKPAERPE